MPGVEWLALATETLADADRGELATLGLPTKQQAAVLSPTAPLCAPQHHTEAVLLARARSCGVDVVFGQEVLRVDVGEEGAEALIRGRDSTRAVSARYVIGADGARSIIRSALGIDMVGPGESETVSVSVVFSARLWDLVGERRYGLYPIVRPDISSVFVPSGTGDNWVFGIGEDLVGSMEAFLVGDAAHRVTPRGGTGMNTAIADGYDLGWKLGWVLKSWAGEELLDTYEAERRPVVAHNVMRSVDELGSYRDPIDEIHVDLGVGLRTSGSRPNAGVSRRWTSSAD